MVCVKHQFMIYKMKIVTSYRDFTVLLEQLLTAEFRGLFLKQILTSALLNKPRL